MTKLKLTAFVGEIPKLLPRLLPDMASTGSFNVRLTDGGLTPIRGSQRVHTFDPLLPDDDATIYRHNDEWLSWPGHVYVAPGPVAQDRLYVMGDGVPKLRAGGVEYPLALQPPNTAPTVAVEGTADAEALEITRLYLYTFVTEFGEESQPSLVSDDVVWESGQTVRLSGLEAGQSGRGITKQRIYRSQTGVEGSGLFFIAERDVSTADFVDDIPPESFAEPVPSTFWTPPSDTLTGLVSLPNGNMAAFDGKKLYFCEPFRPHAWPEDYSLTTDYPIVGLGAFGASLVIVTTGNPYVVTGTSPSTMVMEKLELNLPCINARGIVDLGYAVAYPSHDGLVVASQGGARVATEQLFSRDDWRRLSPESFAAGQHEGRYFASYRYDNLRGEEQVGTIIIDLTGSQPFIARTNVVTRSFYYETETGSLYYLQGSKVFEWDSLERPNAFQSWRSKVFIMPRPTNFGAILVETNNYLSSEEQAALEAMVDEAIADNQALYDSVDTLGGELNGSAINQYDVNGDVLAPIPTISRTVAVNVYADDVLVASIDKTGEMARLPSGFKAQKWQIEVTGDIPVQQVTMATAGRELMEV